MEKVESMKSNLVYWEIGTNGTDMGQIQYAPMPCGGAIKILLEKQDSLRYEKTTDRTVNNVYTLQKL